MLQPHLAVQRSRASTAAHVPPRRLLHLPLTQPPLPLRPPTLLQALRHLLRVEVAVAVEAALAAVPVVARRLPAPLLCEGQPSVADVAMCLLNCTSDICQCASGAAHLFE